MFEIIGKTIVSIFTLLAHFLTPSSGYTTAPVVELFSIWNAKVTNMDLVVIIQAVIFIFTLLKNKKYKLFTAGGLVILLLLFLQFGLLGLFIFQPFKSKKSKSKHSSKRS
jgi:hypothetical protein